MKQGLKAKLTSFLLGLSLVFGVAAVSNNKTSLSAKAETGSIELSFSLEDTNGNRCPNEYSSTFFTKSGYYSRFNTNGNYSLNSDSVTYYWHCYGCEALFNLNEGDLNCVYPESDSFRLGNSSSYGFLRLKPVLPQNAYISSVNVFTREIEDNKTLFKINELSPVFTNDHYTLNFDNYLTNQLEFTNTVQKQYVYVQKIQINYAIVPIKEGYYRIIESSKDLHAGDQITIGALKDDSYLAFNALDGSASSELTLNNNLTYLNSSSSNYVFILEETDTSAFYLRLLCENLSTYFGTGSGSSGSSGTLSLKNITDATINGFKWNISINNGLTSMASSYGDGVHKNLSLNTKNGFIAKNSVFKNIVLLKKVTGVNCVNSITLSEAENCYVGDTLTLTPTINPTNSDLSDIIFNSSNPGVASVDQNGLVTGVSEGQTIITATSKFGNNGEDIVSNSCVVTVSLNEDIHTLIVTNEIPANHESGKSIISFEIDNLVKFDMSSLSSLGNSSKVYIDAKTGEADWRLYKANDGTLTISLKDNSLIIKSITINYVKNSSGTVYIKSDNRTIQPGETCEINNYQVLLGCTDGTSANIKAIDVEVDKNPYFNEVNSFESSFNSLGNDVTRINYTDFSNLLNEYNNFSSNDLACHCLSTSKDVFDANILVIKNRCDLYCEIESLASILDYDTDFSDENRGQGLCKTNGYYDSAKTTFNTLSANAQDLFINSNEFANEYNRLLAWALANGDSLKSNDNNLYSLSKNIHLFNLGNNFFNNNSNSQDTIVLCALILISVTSLVCYCSLKRKLK